MITPTLLKHWARPDQQRRERLDTVTLTWKRIVLIGAAVVAVAQFLPAGPARAIVVVPIIVLIPGWSAFLALFGRQRPPDPIVRLTLTVALGMGVTILAGLAINTIGVRLTGVTLLAGFALASWALLSIAQSRGVDASIDLPSSAGIGRVAPRVALVVCCLAAVAAAVTVAAQRLPAGDKSSFIEVSLAPSSAAAAKPLTVHPGQIVSLPLEVRVHGSAQPGYRIVTLVDAAQVSDSHYVFGPGPWRGTVSLAAPDGRCLHQVTVAFVPDHPGSVSPSLLAYLSVSAGPPCRR